MKISDPVPDRNRKPSDLSKTANYTMYRLTLSDRFRYGAIGFGLAALICRTMYKSLFLFLIAGPVMLLLLPVLMKPELKHRRLQRISSQFREAIGILSGYISAGYSVENAFGACAEQLEKLFGKKAEVTQEFSRIHRLALLNRPVGDVLMDFAERTGLQDIRNFAEVFAIAGRTGGNLRDISARTVSVIREKMAVGEEIANMTAGKKFEQKIMNMIPFFIVLYLDLTSPGFLDIMYSTLMGRAVMTVCLLLTGAAYLLSRKILDIKV